MNTVLLYERQEASDFTCKTSVSVFDQTETAGETELTSDERFLCAASSKRGRGRGSSHAPPAGQILTNSYYVLHLKALRDIIEISFYIKIDYIKLYSSVYYVNIINTIIKSAV